MEKFLLIFMVFLMSCSAVADCPPVPAPPHDGPGIPNRPGADEVERIINQQRTAIGLNPIVTVPELICAADFHAKDLNRVMRRCTHIGSNGSLFWERARVCGSRASGEVVACGQGGPEAAVAAWMTSTGHAKIILDPQNTAMAAARDGNYWVVIFRK